MPEALALSDNQNRIFISIASYRDSQLIPTIRSCIAQAANPDNLRFGICWQHAADETDFPYAGDSRFRLLDVPWQDSRGACWARSEIMKQWRGEEWFLQLDSHCRMAPDWDTQLIRFMGETDTPKPILSTYPRAFTPALTAGEHELLEGSPLQIAYEFFREDGIPSVKPIPIPDWQEMKTPLRARFLSGGFLFAPAGFIEDVPYDPELYFLGEEITMSVRAFTSGYDLFYPHRTLSWHRYTRSDAPKHWSDHAPENGVGIEAPRLDWESRKKVRRILTGRHEGSHGLGSDRTLDEFQAYAGLNFRLRRAHDNARRCVEPGPPLPSGWEETISRWRVHFTVDKTSLPPEAFTSSDAWYVAIYDKEENALFEKNILAPEIEEFSRSCGEIVVEQQFESGGEPESWAVCPHSRTSGWLEKLQGGL
jgi:hypothetical protein